MSKLKQCEQFTQRFNELREEKKVSYAKLAQVLESSPDTPNCWASHCPQSFKRLATLAELFDVSADYLLGLTDSKANNNKIKNCPSCDYGNLECKWCYYNVKDDKRKPMGEVIGQFG